MRRLLVLLAALPPLLLSGTAWARSATITSVTVTPQRALVIVWDLPPGAESQEIRISSENTPDPDFGLTGPGYGWSSIGNDFPTTATSFTTPRAIDVGTWFVRVGIWDPQEPPDTRWSNVFPIEVKAPSVAGAVRYVGKTKQGKRIEVRTRQGKVLRVVLTASCKAYGTGTNRRLNGPFDLVGGVFHAVEDNPGGGGSELIDVTGKLKGRTFKGTIRFHVVDNRRGIECNARIPWTATRTS